MTGCECQMVAVGELRGQLSSDDPAERGEAVKRLVVLLTSRSETDRRHGYALYKEGIDEALFRSCLEYRGLIGGFTHPLLEVMERAIEVWAKSPDLERGAAGGTAST